MNKLFHSVITTIQEPTVSVKKLHGCLDEVDGRLIVVGDTKGPFSWSLPDSDFFNMEDQLSSGFSLAECLPTCHYARKNLGYLFSIREGATCLYETDDDNAPLDTWQLRGEEVAGARTLPSDHKGWTNVYHYFSEDLAVWPRGLPLDQIFSMPSSLSQKDVVAPIQQGLVNGSPDVDAVWRLTQDRPFEFDENESVWLAPGQWCPFNTQSTWWFPRAYPLMYVPSFCSFRMCDIWKSFVAQRCLWAMGFGVVFHSAEVVQERNEHNLMKDFEDEVPGYLKNHHIAETLEKLSLTGEAARDLRICYQALVGEGVFPEDELKLVDCWLADLDTIDA